MDKKKNILIIGATSAIAEHCARLWAQDGHSFVLASRNEPRLQAIAADLLVRGAASARIEVFDANDFGRHEAVLAQAIATLGGIDLALIAHGTLGDQKACERDFNLALHELNTNLISAISLSTHLGNYFEARKQGTLAVIGSVAGDRGRQSNYVYGTAKGALSIFLQGLRNRLYRSGVQVLTIKPGFVDTPMTSGIEKNALWASPETIARAIHAAIEKRRDVVYAPWFWLGIMTVVRLVPERWFKRLQL